MKKLFISVFILFSIIICSFSCTFAFAESGKLANVLFDEYGSDEIDFNTYKKVEEDMKERFDVKNLSFYKHKILYDGGANKYDLIEFEQSGYAIYAKNYSKLMEISYESPSPYINKNLGLLYLGAQNYYYCIQYGNSVLVKQCISGEEIVLSINDLDTLSEYSLSISNGNNYLNLFSSGSTYEIASVNNVNIIKNANTSGFNTTENCGYVAASLLVYYASKGWGYNYLYTPPYISNTLVNDIQNGRNGGSWAYDIDGALDEYLTNKGYPLTDKINTWHIPPVYFFYDRVNEDKPVALFGQVPKLYLEGKSDHVVTVYKVRRNYQEWLFGIRTYSDYELTVHYGWGTSYNEVVLSEDAITIAGLVNIHKN